MLIEKLDTDAMHIRKGLVSLANYSDGSLAVVIDSEDDDGYPEQDVVSVYLAAYGMTAPEGHIYIKDEVEHAGLTDALMELGLVVSKEAVTYGPYRTKGYLAKLADSLVFDREVAR